MALLKRLSLICVFAGLYALAWIVWAHWPERPEGPTAAQFVAARVGRELPPGTPRSTVERWLSARGVEHFAYASADDCWDLPETGLKPADLGAVVAALMTDPDRPGNVQVFLVFGQDGQLIRTLVK